MGDKQVVSFYYPSKNLGGAQLLFARVAEYLCDAGFAIKVYGDNECYIAKYLSENQVPFYLSANKTDDKFVVEEVELFILSLSTASEIGQDFNFFPNNRFLFWDLHPNCLVSQMALFDIYNKIASDKLTGRLLHLLEKVRVLKLESMVHEAVESNGLIFMSGYNLMVNKNMFELPENVNLVPIPLSLNGSIDSQKKGSERVDEKIRIGWISRLKRHKNKVLSILVDDICRSPERIELTIIGDGSDRKYMEEYVARKNVQNIKFAGRIDADKLQDYLIRHIDLGISVGTSALEFAKANIPTVLAPAAAQSKYFSKHHDGYAWLHMSHGYDVNTYKENNMINLTLSEIIRDYKSNCEVFGRNAYHYVLKNHSIESVGQKIIELTKINKYTFKDLKSSGIYNKTPYQKFLFSTMDTYRTIKGNFLKR